MTKPKFEVWFCVLFLEELISLKSLSRRIMRWVVKIFFLIFNVKTLHLTNFTELENSDGAENSFKTALSKSPEELTFDRVWDAYNGLRHRIDSALARGHYTSQGSLRVRFSFQNSSKF